MHKTKHGGYLSIHKDFNVLPDSYSNTKQLLRCINVIGYLTDEDQEFNNGSLEFWKDGKVTKLLKDLDNLGITERQKIHRACLPIVQHNFEHFYGTGLENILWPELINMLNGLRS